MKKTGNGFGRGLAIGSFVLLAALGLVARAETFGDYANKNGCDSIVTDSGRHDCKDLQARKNEACNRLIDCDVDKQDRTIEKYNDARKRLDAGVADADRDRLIQTIRDLRDELDERKAGSRVGRELAERCVSARATVQDWFEHTAIPLTEHARDDALKERKDLLEKLADAQRKVRDAKDKRDANPDDSNLRSEWEKASEEMREIEKQLDAFNERNGKDIEYHAERLLRQYKEGKSEHEKAVKDAENRVEKCKKLDDLSYDR